MELDELKDLWQAEDKNLDSKIELNRAYLTKMNMESADGGINKIFNTSLLGRNMALIYCFVSTGMAIFMIEAIEYSVPAILGGLAMLWSFISHLSIEKPNYKNSIIQLQKTICNFRIHLAANARYDILIAAAWFLSTVPIFLKIFYSIQLYSNHKALVIFCLVACITLALIIALSRKVYAKYDRSLKKYEAHLAMILQFETETPD